MPDTVTAIVIMQFIGPYQTRSNRNPHLCRGAWAPHTLQRVPDYSVYDHIVPAGRGVRRDSPGGQVGSERGPLEGGSEERSRRPSSLTPWPTTERTLERQLVEGEVITALNVLAQVGAEKQLACMHTG